jgi:hypothetical protein
LDVTAFVVFHADGDDCLFLRPVQRDRQRQPVGVAKVAAGPCIENPNRQSPMTVVASFERDVDIGRARYRLAQPGCGRELPGFDALTQALGDGLRHRRERRDVRQARHLAHLEDVRLARDVDIHLCRDVEVQRFGFPRDRTRAGQQQPSRHCQTAHAHSPDEPRC